MESSFVRPHPVKKWTSTTHIPLTSLPFQLWTTNYRLKLLFKTGKWLNFSNTECEFEIFFHLVVTSRVRLCASAVVESSRLRSWFLSSEKILYVTMSCTRATPWPTAATEMFLESSGNCLMVYYIKFSIKQTSFIRKEVFLKKYTNKRLRPWMIGGARCYSG